MAFQLKTGQPGFEVISGEMKGARFEPGKKYKVVPDQFKNRFVKVKPRQAQPADGSKEKTPKESGGE